MNTDIFCTPEQGKRLKELLPELEPTMVWVFMRFGQRYSKLPMFFDKYKYDHKRYKRLNGSHIDMDAEMYNCFQHKAIAPALTLQELRDVALKMGQDSKSLNKFNELLWINNAPELADWVIARLEEVASKHYQALKGGK
jgi:hypothetical protein